MKPSFAFQVTADDVRVLLAQRGYPISADDATALFERHVAPHAGPGGRIEQAALQGDGLEEQTELAQEDMACVLAAAGALPAIPC